MRLVDAHCHIDLYRDYADVIREAEAKQVFTVAVTNTPSVFRRCRDLLGGTRYLHPAVGLHPQLVAERYSEAAMMLDLVGETPYVGEIGLDFAACTRESRLQQADLLARILARCAEVGGRILSVHSRRAAGEAIELLAGSRAGTPILHWYSGRVSLVDRAVSAGCYFSVNPAMLRSENGRRVIAHLPKERVLTETDGPFVKAEGRPARPADVADAISSLAAVWGEDVENTAGIVESNLMAAFQLESSPWEA